MSDLISRQAAKNKKVYSEERHEYVVPVAELDWLPSAEPEIIRCKDCLHWKHSEIRPNYCGVWEWCNTGNDFCSFAERKSDE